MMIYAVLWNMDWQYLVENGNPAKGRVYADTKRGIRCTHFTEYLSMVRCFL